MNQYPTIDIVLAAYNGERFLGAQVQSILDQTYPHWRLIIRDDSSTDQTPNIIQSYTKKYPDKIVKINDAIPNLGACKNFAKLLEQSFADYTMFCDQDDVWLPMKIAATLKKMKTIEEIYGQDMPLLVYTDMKIVDDRLSVISGSFWRNQAFNPEIGRSLSRFLVSNVATGCTMMINKKLRKLSVPLPQEALMHDWWMGLVSAALGKNAYLSDPTVLYRQHDLNVVGATWDISIKTVFKKMLNFKRLKSINREHLLKTQKQAAIFASRYEMLLSRGDYEKIMVYAKLDSMSFIRKRYYIIRYGFWWAGFIRSAVMFLII